MGILSLLFRPAVLALVVLQLAGPWLPFDSQGALAAAAALVLLAGLPLMSRGFRTAAVAFLVLGLGLLLQGGKPLESWISSITSLTNIVAIIAVMQTFSLPIALGGYDTAIRSWMAGRFRRRSSLFAFVTVTTHVLTSFLNLGSVPIVVSLFGEGLRKRIPSYERFFAGALTRGYVLSALWSPGAVNVYLVIQATGLSWSRVFLPGFILALVGMGLSGLLEGGRRGVLSLPGPQADSAVAGLGPPAAAAGDASPARAWQVLFVAAAFVLVMLLFEALHVGAASSRMVLAGGLISATWLATLRRRPGFGAALRGYWNEGLVKVADIAPFFIAMGLFSGALEGSGLMEGAGPALQGAAIALGPASVLLIAALIVILSLVGLHPFVTIVLFGKILAHAELPIPPLTVALSLAVGGAAAYVLTPFAGVIMTVARLVGAKASDVAIRWNWRFSLLFLATGLAFAFGWGAAFG